MKLPVVILSAVMVMGLPLAASAQMVVGLQAPWDGKRVPKGQHCQPQGGQGATPAMQVSGLPKGTASVVVQFNDRDFGPLSRNGGHGQIGVAVKGNKVSIPSVPGMTAKMPQGVTLVAAARSTGELVTKGYLPPCSNRRDHRYFADVLAVGADGKVLDKATVELGRY